MLWLIVLTFSRGKEPTECVCNREIYMKYRTGPLDCGGCKVQPPCSEQVKDPGTLVLSSSPKAGTLMTGK